MGGKEYYVKGSGLYWACVSLLPSLVFIKTKKDLSVPLGQQPDSRGTDRSYRSDQLEGSSKDVAERQGPEPKNKAKRSEIQAVKLGNKRSGNQGL